MTGPLNILILGASYGSLLGTKILMGGHNVHLICLPAEAELFNSEGAIVRTPIKGRDGLVEIRSKDLPGKLTASGPGDVDPATFDLIALAMQEPQYRSDGVRQLLEKVAKSGKPCMSIMNMPPLPYLARIPGLDVAGLRSCFTDATVWDSFDIEKMTLCSPDPQAFRPPEEKLNVLQVRLPTNFKAARFKSDADTAIMKRLEVDIEAARFAVGSETLQIPVKLKVYDSIFVPMAKWAMLIAGNYRCVKRDGIVATRDAVHANIEESREIYEWVEQLCISLGADPSDMVPFEKYANAALSLLTPASAARALANGAMNIERVDLMVKTVAAQRGKNLPAVDEIVATVESWLAKNRAKPA
ncbi:MAG: hypothetical protein K2X10_00535 [Hyphomicrobiales bacterium]|nr:hypothetical protein [Hyphomicrobiales bacterium]OQW84889.1 MAG: hypothetical protein BVN31_02200 [Proteobacteria bacterium ST_bin15]